MTPDEALKEASGARLRPVYLVAGDESLLVGQVVSALRTAGLEGGIVGLNDDSFVAGPTSAEDALATARTMPMMAARRVVVVSDIERWDSKKAEDDDGKKGRASGLDLCADYAKDPMPSTVLLLVSLKLDKRRRLYTQAKKDGWLVACETPKRAELPGWIQDRVKARGSSIPRTLADLLAELLGPELAPIADAIERLTLFVGDGAPITEEAISECVVRMRTASVWELVTAVSNRDVGQSLRLLDDVYSPSDRGLPLLGTLAWATRQLLRFDEARKSGLSPADAAKAAGAPPFKASELDRQLRTLTPETLEQWIRTLARTDLALKGDSKRPPLASLERMVIELCRG